MNLGTIATIARYKPRNLLIIILDNKSYSSTGGQRTASAFIKLDKVLRSFGAETYCVDETSKLRENVARLIKTDGPHVIVVQLEEGNEDVPRIPYPPEVIKARFIRSTKK